MRRGVRISPWMLRSLTRSASIPPPWALLWLGSSVYERATSVLYG